MWPFVGYGLPSTGQACEIENNEDMHISIINNVVCLVPEWAKDKCTFRQHSSKPVGAPLDAVIGNGLQGVTGIRRCEHRMQLDRGLCSCSD